MKKIFLLFFIGVINLYAFNPEMYDLNRPLSKKINVDLKKIEDPIYVAGIIKKLNDEIAKSPEDARLYFLRNMYFYILWDISPISKKAAISKIALKYAVKTSQLFPESPDGWTFRAIFLGTYGISKGVLNALSVARDMRIYALKAYKIDKSYFYAQPPQLLGRLYFKLPSFPVSFGDLDKARKYLYEAYKLAPGYAHVYMYIAELEASVGNIKKAEEFLDKLPGIKVHTYFESLIKEWTLRTLPKARRMLKERLDRYNYDFLVDPMRHPANNPG